MSVVCDYPSGVSDVKKGGWVTKGNYSYAQCYNATFGGLGTPGIWRVEF